MKQIDHYHVLLVDDEHFLRQSLRRRFEEIADDFRIVAEASDGQEALRALKEHDIQVVITDIRMPVMDGLELAMKIRDRYPGILTVILSGYAEFEYARTAIQHGVAGYLLKPVSGEDLENTLAALRTRLQEMYELPDEASSSRLGARESVHKAIRYMQEHYMEDIDIGSLADSLGFHSAYLTRLFNRYVGETPLKYLTGIRIEEAKKLLRDSSLSIADVGERVGYPDQFHFSKTFRKATGMNPSAFRKLDE
ncbi:MAG: response regulator [Lachnospiraceae bacterium]|nr:response regulator [Lachnospiraceae bacterium]